MCVGIGAKAPNATGRPAFLGEVVIAEHQVDRNAQPAQVVSDVGIQLLKRGAFRRFAGRASPVDEVAQRVHRIGLLGSHGANAVPLLATLMAWGREGIAARIEASMAIADRLADWAWDRSDVILYGPNRTGLVLWRPSEGDARDLLPRLPSGSASLTTISGTDWVRNVAANPGADIAAILEGFEAALTQP